MNNNVRKALPTLLAGSCILLLMLVALRRPSSPVESAGPSRIPAVRMTGENHWKILSTARKHYLLDAERLNRELHLQPTMGSHPDTIIALTIEKVAPDSPIYTAGFRKGDRVVTVNGTPVGTLGRALNLVHEVETSSSLHVQIDRDGKIIDYQFDFE